MVCPFRGTRLHNNSLGVPHVCMLAALCVMRQQSEARLPGLERDARGRIIPSKERIRAELQAAGLMTAGGGAGKQRGAGFAATTGTSSPTWSSMISGRLTGKYDLSPAAAVTSGSGAGISSLRSGEWKPGLVCTFTGVHVFVTGSLVFVLYVAFTTALNPSVWGCRGAPACTSHRRRGSVGADSKTPCGPFPNRCTASLQRPSAPPHAHCSTSCVFPLKHATSGGWLRAHWWGCEK
jgi:hypothetical protein